MSEFTPFFTNKNNIATPLLEGEKEIVIKQDFPNANFENIRFLADSSIVVLTHNPIQGLSTLSVERISKAIYFPYSDGTKGSYALPEKIITPKFVGKEVGVFDLCKSYYCMNVDYRVHEKNKAELKEYKITYNCIGWAFGVHDWINPILGNLDINNTTKLENIVKGFLKSNLKIYEKLEKKSYVVYDVLKNIKSVSCSDNLLDLDKLRKDGTIAFYFKNASMTHAARYVSIFEGQEINAWTSKLGQNIMITHELEDLSGENSIYGIPLCYGFPELSTQTHFSGIISIIGEVQNL